jgi:hypothetical protein
MRADALVRRLGKLTVNVSSPAPDLEVRRDGQIVRAEVWGLAMPTDAGEHTIEARAKGRVAWRGKVKTADGAAAEIVVPELGVAAPGDAEAASSPVVEAPPSDALPAPGRDHTAAAIALGASVVFVGVGVLGLVEHGSSVNSYNADPACPSITSSSLPAQCSSYVSAAGTWNTVGIVGLVAGGAAALTGVTLWIFAPTHGPQPAAHVCCAAGLGGVTCGGAF